MDVPDALTEREFEILRLIADGHSNRAIADMLFLTVGTVKWHNKHIYAKLGVSNRTQAVVQANQQGLFSKSPMSSKHNLPSQTTEFIGRQNELVEIRARLMDPTCRLLTLFGPGGTGKTRLALQVAHQCLDNFADGVFFCSLQGVSGGNQLITSLANAIGFSISGQQKLRDQLLNYLHHKNTLLVIDNFEHLLEDSVLLGDLLESAPAVKMLVTSRELLKLRLEWLYYVHGLPYPQTVDEGDPTTYSAVKLFEVRSRQVRPSFVLEESLEEVVRICQFVEGLPLAIELAASWLRVLDVTEIVDRLQTGIEFLAASHRDVPVRHRSMRAVFDTTWQILDDEQQLAFQKLAVFRGGFDLEAARMIVGASLPMLATFVDKALLYRLPDGRFTLHDLLRQYAEDHLRDNPSDHRYVYETYSAYYADFLSGLRSSMVAEHQREAERKISREIQNIQNAWQWIIDNKRSDLIQKSSQSLYQYFRFNSRYLEAGDLFEAAINSLTDQPLDEAGNALAEVLCYRGWTCVRSGEIQMAQSLFERSHAIYATLHTAPMPGTATDPLTGFGIIACVQGNYDDAIRIGLEALALNEARGDPWNQSQAHYVLASAYFALGDFDRAEHHARRAHTILSERDERWFITYLKNLLGSLARVQGRYQESADYFKASYDLYQEFEDQEGIARTLNQMGQLAFIGQNYRGAQEMYLQSYRYYLELGDQGGLGLALHGLGTVANALGEHEAAHKYLQQTLQIALGIQYVPLICATLISLGEVLIAVEQPEVGIPLLGFVDHHPACQQEQRVRIHEILERTIALDSNKPIRALYDQGRIMDFEVAISMGQTKIPFVL